MQLTKSIPGRTARQSHVLACRVQTRGWDGSTAEKGWGFLCQPLGWVWAAHKSPPSHRGGPGEPKRQLWVIRLLWPNHQGPLVWYLHCVPAKSSIAQWASPHRVIQEQLPEGLQRMFLHTLVINSTYPFLKASLLPSQIKIHIWPWQQSGREPIHHYPTQVLLPAESK